MASNVVKSNGSPTVYALRRAFGMKAKRASAYNACIGARLKGKSYNDPPGEGGRLSKAARANFIDAVGSCKR